jgi:3-carboxy-cis,cis-muconate cycloisomerase
VLLSPGSARWPHLTDDLAVLQAMLDVEVGWLRVQARLGIVEDEVVALVSARADVTDFDLAQVDPRVEAGGNPVIPMLAALRAAVGADTPAAQAIHRGLTSQDVLDSALMLLARRALDIVLDRLGAAADATARLAEAHRHTLLVARTLSQPALPTTFGAKAAGWLSALDEARSDVGATASSLPVQCGGAAGTLAAIDALAPGRALEAADLLAEELGLASPGRPWHTDRTPVTRLGDALARTTDVLGKIAGDVVLLSRPELGELSEPAAEGRGGSSTLPQKRNPVLSILVRSVAIEAPHLAAALHSAAALASDERPDGAWHAEWRPLTALLAAVPVAASQLADVLDGLEVHTAAMRRNVEDAGPALVAERLLAAVPALPGGAELAPKLRAALRSGASREEVHGLLRTALPAAEGEPDAIPDATIDDLLSPAAYLGVADALVDRALGRHRTTDQGGR